MPSHRSAAAILAALALAAAGCRGQAPTSDPPASAEADPEAADTTTALFSAATVPIPELGYNAREGRTLYRHYCQSCHGEEGAGDGFNAYNLDPKPKSLADSTFQADHSDSDLVTAIRSGGAAVGLANIMPPWGHTLNERQIHNIVDFLRTLPATEASEP